MKLNSQNKVELIGTYGGDLTHAMSAWTSTRRDLDDERVGRMHKLLGDLARDGHHTPFEKSAIHFLVRCDKASAIHLLKHRIGVSINEESARYKELKEDEAFFPSDVMGMLSPDTQDEILNYLARGYDLYHRILAEVGANGGSRKRAKETARYVLPMSNVTTLDVQFNFRSFTHFLGLRCEAHAQDEIHEIAQQMLELVWATGDFDLSILAFQKTGVPWAPKVLETFPSESSREEALAIYQDLSTKNWLSRYSSQG